MYQKLAKLFILPLSGVCVWICNGRDFDNLEMLFSTHQGKGTRILL
jgi:isopentenyl phosphate kinase